MVLLPTNLSAAACGQTDISSQPPRAPHCPPPGADSCDALLVGLCVAHEGQHGLLWCPGRLAGGIGTHTTYVDPQANTAGAHTHTVRALITNDLIRTCIAS